MGLGSSRKQTVILKTDLLYNWKLLQMSLCIIIKNAVSNNIFRHVKSNARCHLPHLILSNAEKDKNFDILNLSKMLNLRGKK